MVMPNRNASASDYRYGFQDQEIDPEIKGEPGNSINFKYRMHDPRVGRFFAVDPLSAKYPHYSPYSFSGNKVIHRIEIEGLEDGSLSSPSRDWSLQRVSGGDLKEYYAAQGQVMMWTGVIIIDVFVTKGAISKELVKQYVTGTVLEYVSGSEQPFIDGFESVDVFDATLEGMLTENDTEANRMAVNMLSSLADLGINGDGTSSIDGSKPIKHIVIDLAFNIVNDKMTFLSNGSYAKVGEEILDLTSSEFNKLLKDYNVGSAEINVIVNGEKVVPKPVLEPGTNINTKRCLNVEPVTTYPTPAQLSKPADEGNSSLEFLKHNNE
jgi:RHS repeat-associated protein